MIQKISVYRNNNINGRVENADFNPLQFRYDLSVCGGVDYYAMESYSRPV